MANEQEALQEKPDEEEGLKPGEIEIELPEEDAPGDDDVTENKPAPTQEERKTRRERREEHESRRIADQVRTQLESAQARMRQELQQEFEAKYRPSEPEPKAEPADDSAEIKNLRKHGQRLLRLMKDPETPDDEVRELTAEYQELQEKIIGEVARRSAPKTEAGTDPLAIMLQTDFSEFYANPNLMRVARERGSLIAQRNPGMHPFAVARQSFVEVRQAIERSKAKQSVSPEQASKYGTSTSSGGPRDSGGGSTRIVLTKNQRDLALSTYSDKTQWSEEKKIEEWARKQKKLGLL